MKLNKTMINKKKSKGTKIKFIKPTKVDNGKAVVHIWQSYEPKGTFFLDYKSRSVGKNLGVFDTKREAKKALKKYVKKDKKRGLRK